MELTTIQFFHGATRKLLDVGRGVTNPWNGIEGQQYKNSKILCAVIATDYYRSDTITDKPVVFLRPTRLRILTGRRQTSWLFIRVTVRSWTWDYREQIQHLGRGLNSLFPDYNSSALLPPDKKLRGLRNYRDQCVPCEIRARFFSFRHFSCFFSPTFSATFLTADHIHQRLIQA